MKLSISTTFPQVQRQMDRLQADVREKATVRAVNRTMEQARTDMSKEIRSEYAITAERVRAQLRIKAASFKQGRFSIEAALIGGNSKGRAQNLIRFVEGSVTLAEGRRRAKAGTQGQVFVKIKRKGGKQGLGPRAFIGNKGRTVFQREGKTRLPIKAMRTIDVAQMFNTKTINAAVVRKMREKFPEIWRREVAFYTRQFGG